MKSEDHIRFLSDLLCIIDELQTLVRDHCREMTEDEENRIGDVKNTTTRKSRSDLSDRLSPGRS
jgi:hypothetical protein